MADFWVQLGENISAHCVMTSLFGSTIIIRGTGDMFEKASDFYVFAGDVDDLTFYKWSQAVDMFKIGETPDGRLTEGALYIPDGITSIADEFFHPFDYIQSLTHLYIGKDVKRIGNSAFENSYSELLQVYIHEEANIESLGEKCFYRNHLLEYIDFHGKTKVIGADCFGDCRSVTELNLSTELESIPRRAFNNCHKLKWFNKGNVVNNVNPGSDIFGSLMNCHALDYLTIADDAYIEGKKTCWLALNAGTNCDSRGLQITKIKTRNPMAIAIDWEKDFNRTPIFVMEYPFIKLNHLGRWCSINGYDRSTGSIPITHNGLTLYLKEVDEGSPEASPLVFAHNGRWRWIGN